MRETLLEFLKDLKSNNNRDWFQANKHRYEKARHEFEAFIDELIPGIREIDPLLDMVTAKDCVFRIYRDVRFSADKSPYKPNMGAYMARGGKSSQMAGYYVHMEPGGCFLAGGLYMPQPDILKKVREEIYFKPGDFKEILYDAKFFSCFGEMDDEGKMKNPPKGYPKDFPDIRFLKYRSFAVMHNVPDKVVWKEDYTAYAWEVFRTLYPLNAYFNRIFM